MRTKALGIRILVQLIYKKMMHQKAGGLNLPLRVLQVEIAFVPKFK
jgi:hypothetical protein